MRKKLSKLSKIILPFLAFPIISSSAYSTEKDLDNFVKNFPKTENRIENKSEDEIPFYLSYSGNTGSYHFDRSAEANEENYIHGIGLRLKKDKETFGIKPSKDTDLFLFGVTNSAGYYSRAIGFNRKEICTETPVNVCAGWGMGIVDGYPQYDFKPVLSYPLFHASVEYKRIGIDTYISPIVIMWTFKFKL